jgi:mycothiol synthase
VPDPRITSGSQLTSEQIDEVLALVRHVTAAEGVEPLSEAVMLQVRHGRTAGTRHIMVRSGGELTGYAYLDLDANVAELATADAAACRTLVEVVAREHGDSVQVWAHGAHTATASVLRELGFRPERVVLQMRRSLLAPPLAAPQWPPGVSIRTFAVGRDEPAWLDANTKAFSHHPDQAQWTIEDILAREQEPWFDPAGFFLAERDGTIVGFHWTKVHDADRADRSPLGEVYIVGVVPSMQGQRLGPALTLAGLSYLQQLGLDTAMLYADESNTAAVKIYERLGFTRFDADIRFQPR